MTMNKPILLCILSISMGCSAPELAPAGIEFVQSAMIVDGGIGSDGRALSDGRELIDQPWTPGQVYEIKGRRGRAVGTAPASARCLPLFHLGLGHTATWSLSFSEDGEWLSLTSPSEVIRVVDAWRGIDGYPETTPRFSRDPSPIPARCAGGPGVDQSVRAPDGLRYAALEGPIPEGQEVGYRVTVYR